VNERPYYLITSTLITSTNPYVNPRQIFGAH
jgi:hypothetical protein